VAAVLCYWHPQKGRATVAMMRRSRSSMSLSLTACRHPNVREVSTARRGPSLVLS
jgi:hypothetical protein